jgi:MFS transporter, UMF1 family
LIANIALYSNAEALGSTGGLLTRVCMLSAGIWWLLFTMFPATGLPAQTGTYNGKTTAMNFRQTIVHAMKSGPAAFFLFAYFFYNDAIQTVIGIASQFGSQELQLEMATLTTTILIVQFVAIGGSLLFEQLAARTSTKVSIIVGLCIWLVVILAAYVWVHTATDFMVLGAIIGIVLGGTQALSRSLYSRLIPAEHAASYFSLYEIFDKGSSLIGPLVVGVVLQQTKSYRIAVVSLSIFFVIGIILLSRVHESSKRPISP